jgi:hypothetical protein
MLVSSQDEKRRYDMKFYTFIVYCKDVNTGWKARNFSCYEDIIHFMTEQFDLACHNGTIRGYQIFDIGDI